MRWQPRSLTALCAKHAAITTLPPTGPTIGRRVGYSSRGAEQLWCTGAGHKAKETQQAQAHRPTSICTNTAKYITHQLDWGIRTKPHVAPARSSSDHQSPLHPPLLGGGGRWPGEKQDNQQCWSTHVQVPRGTAQQNQFTGSKSMQQHDIVELTHSERRVLIRAHAAHNM